MARIHDTVLNFHLAEHPREEEMLKPFLNGFDITWGRRRRAHNTELSEYFLKPENFMAEMFGFNQEVMLVYSSYSKLEPRAMQAVEQFLEDDPARGRVEKLTVFLISESDNPDEWIKTYLASNHEARIVVSFNASALRNSKGDSWYVRNQIASQLYSRDLFDYRLPLEKDTYFFGRDEIVMDYRDAAQRGENRGIFGLRKTGKTSLLFKLIRLIRSENYIVIYYDCKSPSVRQLLWYELLEKIGRDIATSSGVRFKPPEDKRKFADRFNKLLKNLGDRRVVLIFDEIEYISPLAISDPHWRDDFVTFWQTIWAAQSLERKLSAIIAGVNPTVLELNRIGGTQNPLFGIVPYAYLKGLGIDEARRMLRVLGRRMGINFSDGAVTYLFNRYGGHPLLIRLAASFTHKDSSSASRPFVVTDSDLAMTEARRDAELSFYCNHIISELRDFYPDEYHLLEWLSSGNIADYLEYAEFDNFVRHLREYGLVEEDSHGVPSISLPVLARYVALEAARRDGRRTILRVVPEAEREIWLSDRVETIASGFEELQRLARTNSIVPLFGPNSFPESHNFYNMTLASSDREFDNFIGCAYKCFVESIDNWGKATGRKRYFWEEIAAAYPFLQHSLHRVRVYRHQRMHIVLNPGVELALKKFLDQDLELRQPGKVDHVWFVLQQATLDALHNSLQVEISRLSR